MECKDFSTQADEVMTPNNEKVEMVNVGGQRMMKISAKPDWKWSADIKPVVGTASCQAKHVSVIVEGSIKCRHNDGSEMTYKERIDVFGKKDLGNKPRIDGCFNRSSCPRNYSIWLQK